LKHKGFALISLKKYNEAIKYLDQAIDQAILIDENIDKFPYWNKGFSYQ